MFTGKTGRFSQLVFVCFTLPFMVFIDGTSRDVRPPTAGGAAAAGAAAEKSLAAPSHSGIIAHSFARTHDTCTKTKPKSISRLGSLKDSPPNLQYIYTYKTTLRVIRRLWGVGVQRFTASVQTAISHRTPSNITSILHRHLIGITSI